MNFTFLNIPVRIQPTFWIFLLFFTNVYRELSIVNVIVGVVMIVSLLFHEYGHALTAAYFGAKPTVTLEAFGGNASYQNRNISRTQQIIITLNGPLFESILIAIPYFLLKSDIFASHPYIEFILYLTMRLNILWCLLNLIPIEPLDGGQIIRNLLEAKFGPKGYKASLVIGLLSVGLIAPYLYLTGRFFFSILLVVFGIQTLQKLRHCLEEGKISPFSFYMRAVEEVDSNQIEEAKQKFKKLIKTKDIQIRHSAIESLAKIYVREDEGQKAYKLLLKSDHHLLKEGKRVLWELAFKQKNYELVGAYSRDVYTMEPTYETAVLNSQAFAYMNQPHLAGGWLVTASRFGIEYNDKVKELLKQASFDSVRDHKDFNEAIKVMTNSPHGICNEHTISEKESIFMK